MQLGRQAVVSSYLEQEFHAALRSAVLGRTEAQGWFGVCGARRGAAAPALCPASGLQAERAGCYQGPGVSCQPKRVTRRGRDFSNRRQWFFSVPAIHLRKKIVHLKGNLKGTVWHKYSLYRSFFFFLPTFLAIESYISLCEAPRTFTLNTFHFEKSPFCLPWALSFVASTLCFTAVRGHCGWAALWSQQCPVSHSSLWCLFSVFFKEQ